MILKFVKKIFRLINDWLYYCCWIFPTNPKLIVMESEGDLCDNAYALYDFMKSNNYLRKYKIVWLVQDIKKARSYNLPQTTFCKKWGKCFDIKRSYYLATCKHYIYDHCNVLSHLHIRKQCTLTNLWHGCGIKCGKSGSKVQNFNYLLSTGQYYVDILCAVFNCSESKIVNLGYPRNDYFFRELNTVQHEAIKKYHLDKFNKVFLWMPTFRNSINPLLSEDYFDSMTGLPIIESEMELAHFNEYLKRNNCLCVFKIHHLQLELKVFQKKYSNFLFLNDDELSAYGLQLYQFIPLTDCLITDYSSVSNDYMLLDKPIIYTTDDYDEYHNSRGFIFENPSDYFVGQCVTDISDLYSAMDCIISNEDPFKEKRHNNLHLMHTYFDGDASKRIVKFLNL